MKWSELTSVNFEKTVESFVEHRNPGWLVLKLP